MSTAAGRQRRAWKRRSEARPGELRAAALRLFAERGFGATRIEDVAQEAGITVGTVYRYVRDKEALLVDVVDHYSNMPLLSSEESSDDPEVIAERIWRASRTEPHHQMLRLMVAESHQVPDLLRRFRERAIVPLEQALAGGLQRRGANSDDAILKAQAMLGALLGASLLASAPHAMIPQLAPAEVTLPLLTGCQSVAASAPPPSPAVSAESRPSRRPDAW